ncbi:P-loop containing nucleoside triphosphate hydrolase protein [Gorgonomyces haynaldii]|nr:P-loop containing nucleoside triphosphate hydrolase protein [Gorgonomyces haynaldii]
MDCHVSVINGPELHSSFYGETEAKLSNIFEEAKASQPSIIFIDEIDAMCPKRDTSDSELEKRVVATLLTLMDTCKGVFVIGATNRPNAIDDALRRPGRFDREFEIGIPDERRRLDILKRLLKKIPNNLQEQDFEDINARLHGYVGADIAALVKQSGMNCVSRLGKDDTETANDPNLIVEKQDLLKGLGLVRPSIVRDIAVQIPKTRWTDIGGQDDIKQRLKEAVEWPLKHPEVFERFKIQPPKGILLYGPPGNSKTLLAKALATEAGLNFIAVKGPELFSKWVGESEKAVQQVFRKARQASPSIIFFDEIDAIGVKRAGQDASVADRVLSQLLSEMDGVDPLKQVTIVAATNRPDILDSALLRPGRIDSMLYVPPPDHETRKRIFEIQIRKMPTDNLDLEHLAALSDGFSGAETVAVCQKAAMNAMEENMDCSTIEQRHFEQAIRSTVPRLNQELLQFYIDFQNQNGLHAI